MKIFRGQPGFLPPFMHGEGQSELLITDLSLMRGGSFALNNIDLSVRTGEVVAVIGPKGAGKTSLMDCITGAVTPGRGMIRFNDEDITGKEPHYIAGLGISRTFQRSYVFPEMTVLSNLLIARHSFYRYNIFNAQFFTSKVVSEEGRNRGMAEVLIDLFEMQHLRKVLAMELPYGMMKRLDIARALAMEPRMLILDDPFTGMSYEEIEDIKRILLELNKIRNISMILSEDEMSEAARMSNRVLVLDFGIKIAEGPYDFVANHPKVKKIYTV